MQKPIGKRRRSIALVRRLSAAVILGFAVLGVAPMTVAAADASPSPPIESPVPTPTPEPTPVPTPTPEPTPVPPPTPPPTPIVEPAPSPAPVPTPIIESFVIYRRDAVVRQYTKYTCVPATTQTMLNLIAGTNDRSLATQMRYYQAVRKNNRYSYRSLGNDPRGWAWGLRYFSGGTTTYRARGFDDKNRAMWAIHESIARTGSPVGITVWGGTHAWVVLGYQTATDPLDPSRTTLLGFYVSGPLGSSSKDPWTYKFMKLADFRKHFSRYHEWQRRVVWEDKWVIISQ